jgi:hypothetical protein
MTASDSLQSLLDYERLLFCMTNLVMIYELVTSSASVVHWLTLHSGHSTSEFSYNWIMAESIKVKVRVTLWLVVYHQSVHLGIKPLETHDEFFFFQLNSYGNSPYVTSSLMRGWVCSLQFLLGLASTVILRSRSHGTHDHILLSQDLRLPQPGWLGHPPGTGWPGCTPRHWVPFLSPPTTHRAMVEVCVEPLLIMLTWKASSIPSRSPQICISIEMCVNELLSSSGLLQLSGDLSHHKILF